MTNDPERIQIISTELLIPSPTNPRQHFNETKLDELAESVRKEGVLSPLWVRPSWAIGCSTAADVARTAKLGREADYKESYEIVAGERRFRSALIAELTEVPCLVRLWSDRQALENQLAENLQRDDLTPLEEAQGLQAMLNLQDDNGEKVYSSETLAAKIGKSQSHVYEMLKLLLLPRVAKDAVEDGRLYPKVAMEIGRVPDAGLRDQLAREVLEGSLGDGSPMTLIETKEHVARKYMRSLSTAKFDRTDGALVADASPCELCPHLAKNSEDESVRSMPRAGDNCLNPLCFEKKELAAFARFKSENEKEGIRVLTKKENSQIVHGENFRSWTTEFVMLDSHPSKQHLNPGVTNKKTWRQLIEGRGVEIVVAQTDSGKPLWGVDIKKAIAAAVLNGHDIFPKARNAASQQDHEAEEKKRKQEVKERHEYLKFLMPRLSAAVKGDSAEWVDWISRLLVVLIDIREDLILDLLQMKKKEVLAIAESTNAQKVCGLAAQVLVIFFTDWNFSMDREAGVLLKELGIDPRAVKKAMNESKAKPAAESKPEAKSPAAKVSKAKPASKKQSVKPAKKVGSKK